MEVRQVWLDVVPGATSADGVASGSAVKLEFYLGLDGISLAMILLTTVLTISAVLVSWTAIQERSAEFYASLLILETGLIGVFCAFDLLLFYVFFEFTLIPLFFMVGIWGGPLRRYAAGKFFIYTLAGSVITLLGLIWLVTESYKLSLALAHPLTTPFSIPDLSRLLADHPLPPELQATLFLMIAAGFMVKVPLFPFHTWLPLAHVEAPTAGSVMLAGGFIRVLATLSADAAGCVSHRGDAAHRGAVRRGDHLRFDVCLGAERHQEVGGLQFGGPPWLLHVGDLRVELGRDQRRRAADDQSRSLDGGLVLPRRDVLRAVSHATALGAGWPRQQVAAARCGDGFHLVRQYWPAGAEWLRG